MTNSWAPPNTAREWEQARRAAFVQDILGNLAQRQPALLPFEDVRQNLHLREVRYLGLEDVPLDHIVGSVDRYQDFTRAFFPRESIAPQRWRRVAHLAAVIDGKLPPVELYKVGDAYFVRDGNHRVSVARLRKMPSIHAYVWEYETRVPVGPEITGQDLLLKAALASFLERTNIDRLLCDDYSIELTYPDGYDELWYEIEAFQHSLSQIDERDVPLEEAVELWCAMSFTPIVETIRQRQILQEFPGRTEADLYLWLRRNQEELEARYGRHVLTEQAADDLKHRFGSRPTAARRVRKTVGRMAGSVGELGARLARHIVSRPRSRGEDQAAAALLAPVRSVATATPHYRFRGKSGSEWEAWHAEFRDCLWEVLGIGCCPGCPYGPEELKAGIVEQMPIDSLERELVWLNAEEELRVPAYLFRPKEAGDPRAAVVILPGHGTIAQAAGLESSQQEASALALARAGFITLALEPRGFGRLGALDHLQLDGMARLVGRTWYGLIVQDAMRAVDYLVTRPEVDATRIGAAGLGAGGAAAMYLAALDDRIHAAVIAGYLSRYVTLGLDESHCTCNDLPGILIYAEMGDVASLIAPRPVLFINGQADPTIHPGAQESFAQVRHVYQVLGAARRARLVEPAKLGHTFDNQLAISWLERWLGQA